MIDTISALINHVNSDTHQMHDANIRFNYESYRLLTVNSDIEFRSKSFFNRL